MYKQIKYWPIYLCVTLMLPIALLACLSITEVGLYLVFTITAILLVSSTFCYGFSWFYNYFTLFLVLGFWFKITIHHLFGYEYIEPTGDFSGEAEQWATIYMMISFAYLGVISARVLFRYFNNISHADYRKIFSEPVRNSAWIIIFSLVCFVYLINSLGQFYVIGIEPKYYLPFGLSAAISFFINIGVGIILSMFIYKVIQRTGKLGNGGVSLLLFHGLLSSISTASRAVMVMQTLPMLLGSLKEQSEIRRFKVSKKIFILFAVTMLSSLFLVSLYRIQLYMDHGLSEDLLLRYMLQVMKLSVDRWIGAEAVMVSSSLDITSIELFYRLMLESPGQGVDGLYQKLSGSNYQAGYGKVFLTLPGFIGLASFSGSALVVFTLSFLAVLVGLLIEKALYFILSDNQVSLSLLGCTLANAICQMNNLYLLIVFLIELVLFIALISLFVKKVTKINISI